MSEGVYACTRDEIPPGACKVIVHEDQPIVIFNVDGAYFAIGNICPHAGGSLEQGFIENGRVVCSWHGWSFPLSPEDPPNDGLPRYRVLVEGDEIRIEFPAIEVDKSWR